MRKAAAPGSRSSMRKNQRINLRRYAGTQCGRRRDHAALDGLITPPAEFRLQRDGARPTARTTKHPVKTRPKHCSPFRREGFQETCTSNVPESVPDIVPDAPVEFASRRTGPASRASPKSRIFTTPSLPRMMFSGLMSRCRIPAAWAAATARAACLPQIDGLQVIYRARRAINSRNVGRPPIPSR